MGSNVTLSGFAVVLIFVFGFAVGWIMAKMRVGGSIQIGSPPRPIQQPVMSGARSVNFTMLRRLTLKCQCGASWEFAEGPGALPEGARPMPTGDSFVCPKCGKSIDLKQERELAAAAEAEALGNLKLQK